MIRCRIATQTRPLGRLEPAFRASLALVLVAAGCRPEPSPRPAAVQAGTPTREEAPGMKTPAPIEIDLDAIDADGLRGPADGKVAVAYEFTIPDSAETRAQVRAIDPTVEFMPGSRGRIGAGVGECLCVGSTHQANWRTVLETLAAFPGVARIVECHRE